MIRALVVEDSATQAAHLALILREAGFEVEVTASGEEGFARCSASRFDIVLSDIIMPGLSGYDLCRKLKTVASTKDVPVILLTTLRDFMDIIEALECGAENFITKPYEAKYLLARVNNVLANASLRATRTIDTGAEIVFKGKRFRIHSDREQILDLLISSIEDIVRANEQLHVSQAALARANEELEAFVYTASHDLKEPLRGIEAFSRILVDEYAPALDAQGIRYLDLVRGGAVRMRELIDDLLAFFRVGHQLGGRCAVDLRRAVSEALAMLEVARGEAGAEIVVPETLPTLQGHPVLLQELFANLLGNALKYRRTDVSPRIAIGWQAREQGTTEITVADNGIGVPSEYREQVFRLFQRLHGREKYPGTGVGLALCKRIVEEHRGTIGLEETPGGGCTVRFTLAGSTQASQVG